MPFYYLFWGLILLNDHMAGRFAFTVSVKCYRPQMVIILLIVYTKRNNRRALLEPIKQPYKQIHILLL